MSEETKPAGPDYRDTKEIPAVQVPANTLDAVLREMREMRVEQRASTQELKADIALVANDLSVVKERVRLTENRLNDHDERAKAQSERVRQPSTYDLEAQAALAAEREARERLEAKVDGLPTAVIGALAKTPTAKKLVGAILPVLMAAVAVLGARLEMQLADLKAKPTTVQVQPAPTVYLPAATLDGGAP